MKVIIIVANQLLVLYFGVDISVSNYWYYILYYILYIYLYIYFIYRRSDRGQFGVSNMRVDDQTEVSF